MAEENILEQKKPELIDIERKDGILEELDLPPKMIKAIRENSTALQIVGVAIVVFLFGWTYYDYYSANKKAEASAALNLAVQEIEKEKQLEMFRQVAADYSGSEAALWSIIEQGHQAFKDGDYSAALEKYKEVENDLSAKNPLKPILYNSIGLSLENSNDLENALIYYSKLDVYKGFKLNALLARGRILEQQGKDGEALKLYIEASLEKDLTGSGKSILTEKINNLQSSAPGE